MIYEIRARGGLGDVVKWTAYFKKFSTEKDTFQYLLKSHGGGPACWERFKLCFELFDIKSELRSVDFDSYYHPDRIFNMGNPEYASYDNPVYYEGINEKYLWNPTKDYVGVYLNNDRPGWRVRKQNFEDSGKSGYNEDMKRWNFYKLLPQKTQEDILDLLVEHNINYSMLGLPHRDFYSSLKVMRNSAFCIGIEGGWAHMAHALKVPYICLLDGPLDIANMAHPFNPYIQYVRTKHLHKFFESELISKYLNLEIYKGV